MTHHFSKFSTQIYCKHHLLRLTLLTGFRLEENTKESRRNWMLWIFKSAGAKNKRNENYQFWQQDNHPIKCGSTEALESRREYIHENPLSASMIRNEWDYVYSGAIDYYCNENGLLTIDYV